jgi:hypothetical protein
VPLGVTYSVRSIEQGPVGSTTTDTVVVTETVAVTVEVTVEAGRVIVDGVHFSN